MPIKNEEGTVNSDGDKDEGVGAACGACELPSPDTTTHRRRTVTNRHDAFTNRPKGILDDRGTSGHPLLLSVVWMTRIGIHAP